MAVIYKQNGGLNGTSFVGQKSGPASVFGCGDDFQTNMHSTYPYKHNRVSIGSDDFGDGCVCTTDAVLAVGDVIVLAEVPAGQMLKAVKFRIGALDPTLQFDLEVRSSASLATPATVGTVIAAGLGEAVQDGMVEVNRYFSEFGVALCPSKDCYGTAVTGPGRDHGVLTMRITALPTGVPPACATVLAQFGTLKAAFDLVVTDLR